METDGYSRGKRDRGQVGPKKICVCHDRAASRCDLVNLLFATVPSVLFYHAGVLPFAVCPASPSSAGKGGEISLYIYAQYVGQIDEWVPKAPT